MKRRLDWIILVLLVTGMATKAWLTHPVRPAAVPVMEVVPSTSPEGVHAPTVAASVTAPVASPENLPVEVPEPRLCRIFGDQGRFILPESDYAAVVRKQTFTIPRTQSDCLEPGHEVLLTFMKIDPSTQVPFAFRQDLRARIVGFQDFPGYLAIPANHSDAAAQKKAAKRRSRAVAAYGPGLLTSPVRQYKVELLETKSTRASFGAPLFHPLALTADSSRVKELMTQGAVLVDTRPTKFYQSGTIGKALSLAPQSFSFDHTVLAKEMLWEARIPEASIKALPKNVPLVIFGVSRASSAAYNMVNLLYFSGFRNLHYYAGGMADWNKVALDTPASPPGITVVDAERARALVSASGRGLLIDTRPSPEYSLSRIKGARSLPYIEKLSREGYPQFVSAGISYADLNRNIQKYSLEGLGTADPAQPLVFYGRDDLDWAPLKAALLASGRGHTSVYWLRKGFKSWSFAIWLDPNYEMDRTNLSRTTTVRMPAKVPSR